MRLAGLVILITAIVSSAGILDPEEITVIDESQGTMTDSRVDHEGYTRTDLYNKMNGYGRMKKAGFTVAGIGSGLIILGIIGVSSAEWETHATPTGTQATTQDPMGGVGLLSLGLGIPAGIAGLVLGAIGNGKENEYRTRYKHFSLGYSPSTEKISLSVCLAL